MQLPKYVKTALCTLTSKGHRAYVVGGAVRDALLSRVPSDFDITTDASPDAIRAAFHGHRTVDVGARFGTVGVILQGKTVEITTFRSDGAYADARHPDAVTFVDNLREDLARRDFTVNAMAYSPKEGFVDPFGGQEDLHSKVIRAVGDPGTRFKEDALRILRAVRFCAQLGFEMEPATEQAAEACAHALVNISKERIRDELSKFIVCPKAGDYLLKYRKILFAVLPDFEACCGFKQHNPNHCHDVGGHIAETVNRVDRKLVLRLAALLHDIAKPACFTMENSRGRFYGHMELSAEYARRILTELRYPAKTVETVALLVENHDKPYASTPASAREWLSRMGAENVYLIIRLKTADCLAHDKRYHRHLGRIRGFRAQVDQVLRRGDCYSLSSLAVNGRDINRTLGIAPGEATGEILHYLLGEVIAGRAENDRAALLDLARQYPPKENEENHDQN